MWSLPDIQRLNSIARTGKRSLLALAEHINQGKATESEICERCEERRVTSATPLYDLFSDDPKGLLIQCDECQDRLGLPKGFFRCDACDRLMIENYTWDVYRYTDDNGTDLCLPCYAKRELGDEDNWIRLTDEDIAVITADVVRGAKHLIAVQMPIPKSIQLFENVVIDRSTGGEIRSKTHADPTPDAAILHLREILTRAKEDGYERAILILDGIYQCAASCGVYVDNPKGDLTKEELRQILLASLQAVAAERERVQRSLKEKVRLLQRIKVSLRNVCKSLKTWLIKCAMMEVGGSSS